MAPDTGPHDEWAAIGDAARAESVRRAVRRDSTGRAVFGLHVLAALTVAGGFFYFVSFRLSVKSWDAAAPVLAGNLLIATALEVVAAGLRARRLWAWAAAWCVYGYVFASLSVLTPLGLFGLVALFDRGTRFRFGLDGRSG